MTITIEEEGVVSLPIDYETLSNRVIEACVDFCDCPYEAEVSILVTDNETIHAVNMEQREIDRPTDVLSFPLIEWESIGEFDILEENLAYFHPDSGELMLGDIVISTEKVVEQANEYGHTIEREFAFLMVHSMLHLFGYDHMEEDERVVMEKAQSEIMDILGISR